MKRINYEIFGLTSVYIMIGLTIGTVMRYGFDTTKMIQEINQLAGLSSIYLFFSFITIYCGSELKELDASERKRE